MMLISTPTTFKPIGTKPGFSFLELMVVIVMLSGLMAITVPRFETFFEQPQQKEFKNLVRVLKLLRNEAILGQIEYYLIFDLKKQNYHIEKEVKGGSRETVEQSKILKPYPFHEDFQLYQVNLAHENLLGSGSRILQLPVEIHIDSSGFVTPFTVVFVARETHQFWQLQTKNIMGQLEMKEERGEVF